MKLSELQTITFLELVSKSSSNATFERILGLTPNGISSLKKELDIKSPDEARILAKKMRTASNKQLGSKLALQEKEIREAEAVANRRLKEMEDQKNSPRPLQAVDTLTIKQEDAARQKAWSQKQSEIVEPEVSWTLPLEGSKDQREETVARFRREILYRGFNFLFKKYGASKAQIKFEANRLGIKLDWDMVRR